MARHISLSEWKEQENARRQARGERPLSNVDIYDLLDAVGPPLDPVVNKSQKVGDHLNGVNRPDADWERRYLAVTGGQVTPQSWYELHLAKVAEKDAA